MLGEEERQTCDEEDHRQGQPLLMIEKAWKFADEPLEAVSKWINWKTS